MKLKRSIPGVVLISTAAVVTAGLAATAAPAFAASSPGSVTTRTTGATGRYLVVARSSADYAALRARAVAAGAKVVRELPELKTFVITGSVSTKNAVAADQKTAAVTIDGIRKLPGQDQVKPVDMLAAGLRGRQLVAGQRPGIGAAAGITPDPAFNYSGLQWDYQRIGLPQGWRSTAGRPDVTVAVADTGLDYTHIELKSQVHAVFDLTTTEDPPICKTTTGFSDTDLAALLNGPADGDFNGHGSWIGGNIAAALNQTGTNGIAPKVGLVALKISQWCGSAYDSEILDAFRVAANNHYDVVSISFGGYLDRSDPDQDAVYQQYVDAVGYARSQGTVIVAAAGNESARIGPGGLVLSHGTLTSPGTAPADAFDAFGLYETPGGIPGVVDVSSTGNVVNPASRSCPPGSIGSPADPTTTPPTPANFLATCKPTSDPHQAAGQGLKNQLAYYSNYGPRIDIAAPGGARKFNLPNYDRGGTPGFPYTTDAGTNAWEEFSITSNFAEEIPCFDLGGMPGFTAGQCYTSIQGTSMATPHVSAALALEASAHPLLRHHPAVLVGLLKSRAAPAFNTTRAISATDTSPGDLTQLPCPTGYCHLTGPRISSQDAYGSGLLNVAHP